MRRLRLAAIIMFALAALTLAACGDSAQEPVLSTSADGEVVAELRDASDNAWTVTLPAGATEAFDLYGNDGRDPIGIWDEGSSPEVAVGDLFAIGLLQNAGTGYTWRPLDETAAADVVELVEQGVNPNDPGGGAAGSPETHYFVYRATAAGTGTIEFGFFPPGQDQPERTASSTITVSS